MRRQAWITGCLAVLTGAVVGLLAGAKPSLLFLLTAATVGMLVGTRPALVFGTILCIEEIFADSSYFNQAGPLLTMGHQLYDEVKGINPALLLLAVALTTLVYNGRGRTLRRGVDGISWTLGALVVWSATLSLSQETMDITPGSVRFLTSHVLSASMPWLLALLAYATAIRLLDQPDGRDRLTKAIGFALIFRGLTAVLLLATTGGTVIDGQHYLIFYDAALPMVAGMAVLGHLAASENRGRMRTAMLIASLVIVVFSFRRAVWSAVVLGAVLMPFLRRRAVLVVRLLVLTGVLFAGLLVLPASARNSALSRVTGAIAVAQGSKGEDSAQNHQKDIDRGLILARRKPYLGYGVRAPQPREFVYTKAVSLYVHNDFLEVWLKYGLPGLALFVLFIGTLLRRSVRVLTSSKSLNMLDAAAAACGLVLIFPLMTAPFVSVTARWPILVGLAAAVMRTRLTAPSPDSEAVLAQPDPAHAHTGSRA